MCQRTKRRSVDRLKRVRLESFVDSGHRARSIVRKSSVSIRGEFDSR